MTAYLNYSPIDTAVFPDSYASARKAFIIWVNKVIGSQAKSSVYQCAGNTPDGEALFTDTVWLGQDDASKVLVLLAGTHGVEGFVGSAIELDFLHLFAAGEISVPDDTAILIVHALTPWGYAWLRRCDENGVDLNRNAVDFSVTLPENNGYEALRGALFSTDVHARNQACAEYGRQYGRTALEIAISGGQYTDPDGPFYGGDKAAHGRVVTEDLIRRFKLAERDLAVIDLHSGLGPYGYGEIICDHPPGSEGIRVAQTWYGDSVTLPALGTSSSVPKTGLIDYIWHGAMNSRSCHVTLEFGTYATDALFDVILKDHQLWAQQDNRSERLAHSRPMRQHFCPSDNHWQASVLFRARQVVYQAMQGLTRS